MKTLRTFPAIAVAVNMLATGLLAIVSTSQAAPLNLSDNPLFASQSAPPLTLMTMGRDHKLYYEAYNDASDLNGDGVLDTTYKPDIIDYYGYFGSNICYVYAVGNNRFEPSSATTDKRCSGSSEWSGDFLNYLTTSRIDALRKVFYGGTRSVDTGSETVLERSYIPQDAHSWGKEYTDIATNGFDIREYSSLNLPVSGHRHLFANTTLVSENDAPLLRVLNDSDFRVWEWLSKERPVAGNSCINGGTSCEQGASRITDYVVRVRVCVSGRLEANCQAYPNGNSKPVGLLQSYGENDSMYFGLLTGSYEKNTSGGVLRKNVGSITDEINANDGTYTATIGVIGSMDRLRIANFRYGSGDYAPGWPGAWITTRPMNEGEMTDWGNPVAEMMYEGMRYFAGKSSPSPAFSIASSGNDDADLGLPLPNWIDPYDIGNGGFSSCAKPFQIVIADINPSYDSDQLPGSYFGGFTGDVSGLDVSALADTITNNEPGIIGNHFIGQVGAVSDGAPTSKMVTTLSNIRGLAPEEPTKQGSYYSASIGYFGTTNDISSADGDQKIDTFSVALASPLPNIEIPVAGSTITLVPFAKSVGGCLGISSAMGDFQPTNTIVDFYVETLTPTYGKFRINFEDVEQGADHDMDAIAEYEYTVNSNGTVTINMAATYASGCIVQHLGYIISGTTANGTYLEIRDADTSTGGDPDYFLDTPNIAGVALPLTATRTFTPGAAGAGTTFLKDPLWYAAKWGGFQEDSATANDLPDLASEWDEDGNGDPDNYFLVTNALDLSNQLASAFNEIIARSGVSASAAALTSGQINSDTNLIRSTFNTGTWTGDLKSYAINNDPLNGAIGEIASTPTWSAEAQLSSSPRKFFTHDGVTGSGGGLDFTWAGTGLTTDQKALLDKNAVGSIDNRGDERVDFLRGTTGITGFRNRVDEDGNSHILGDMVNSSPVYVSNPRARYPDNWNGSTTEPEDSTPYSAFFDTFTTTPRVPMVYVGGNDGMLHGFNAKISGSNMGKELLAYIPNEVFPRLSALTSPTYSHKFYVDGSPTVADVFFGGSWKTVLVGGLNRGGQAIYALDITNPSSMDRTKVLWEFSDSNDTDADADMQYALGYTYSKPGIVRLHNGKWAAIFGNGYNNTEADSAVSTSGDAVLYIVDIENGSVIRKINTKAGTAANPNGLATVTPVDINGDFITDYVYAGDLLGNMWKFDLTDTIASNWGVAHGTAASPVPLFVAKDSGGTRQPITAKANVGFAANGADLMVYFGTGKYLEGTDNTTTGSQTQAFYGVIDAGSAITGIPVDELLQQTVETFVNTSCTSLDGTAGACDIRVTTNNTMSGGDQGWYMELPEPGERVIYRPILLGGTVLFVTLIPSGDECNPDGSGWLMQLDAFNGGRLDESPFDLNGDGIFDESDQVSYDDDGDSNTADTETSGSGRRIEGGAPTGAPAILNDSARGSNINYTDTTSDTDTARGNAFGLTIGRQSWRQIK